MATGLSFPAPPALTQGARGAAAARGGATGGAEGGGRPTAAAGYPPTPALPFSTPRQVYHVPKTPELDISGMTGTVTAVVTHHKGVEISATMPYRVSLDVPAPEGGKAPKVIVHLAGGELEVV